MATGIEDKNPSQGTKMFKETNKREKMGRKQTPNRRREWRKAKN